MLLELLIAIPEYVLWAISGLLPSYESLPLPDYFWENIIPLFQKMKLILELPIIRKVYEYFLWIFPVWLVFWQWNLIVKLISTIPFLNGLSKFSIKDKE